MGQKLVTRCCLPLNSHRERSQGHRLGQVESRHLMARSPPPPPRQRNFQARSRYQGWTLTCANLPPNIHRCPWLTWSMILAWSLEARWALSHRCRCLSPVTAYYLGGPRWHCSPAFVRIRDTQKITSTNPQTHTSTGLRLSNRLQQHSLQQLDYYCT